jgi:NAD(P)-dependent dehydrogenase (short-subunit alcohol dehydrogenase family)
LITGASSGLGVEFADLLAAQKVNLVLAARRQEPMEKLASDLRRKYGVDVLIEAIDLASRGAPKAVHLNVESSLERPRDPAADEGYKIASHHQCLRSPDPANRGTSSSCVVAG